MDGKRIRVQLVGFPADAGDVKLENFVKQLEALRRALSEMDRAVAGQPSTSWRVVDLRHASPSEITLEATPLDPGNDWSIQVVSRFYRHAQEIQTGQEYTGPRDHSLLQSIRAWGAGVGTTVERMQLLENGSELSITPSLTRNVDNILGPDEFEHGEVSGMLHQINLHARRKAFTVYPTDNSPKVLCTIGEALRREAVAAVDQYVTVFGQLKYSHGVDAPHEMCVESIEIHRPEESATTLGSLRGIAPDATGSLNSEDFVRNLRHGW